MADYIPSDDQGFINWFTLFVSEVDGNETDFGLVEADGTALTALLGQCQVAGGEHAAAQTVARTKTQTKNDLFKDAKSQIRAMVKRIQASPNITDAKRQTLAITVPDTTPTAVTAPTSRPVVMVESNGSLSHKVKFTDEFSPLSNAKPTGATACEIYVKIGGDAPVSIADCQFVGNASKSPYQMNFDSADIGKQAHYLARWVTRTGLTSPTSQLTSWTIAG